MGDGWHSCLKQNRSFLCFGSTKAEPAGKLIFAPAFCCVLSSKKGPFRPIVLLQFPKPSGPQVLSLRDLHWFFFARRPLSFSRSRLEAESSHHQQSARVAKNDALPTEPGGHVSSRLALTIFFSFAAICITLKLRGLPWGRPLRQLRLKILARQHRHHYFKFSFAGTSTMILYSFESP